MLGFMRSEREEEVSGEQ